MVSNYHIVSTSDIITVPYRGPEVSMFLCFALYVSMFLFRDAIVCVSNIEIDKAE